MNRTQFLIILPLVLLLTFGVLGLGAIAFLTSRGLVAVDWIAGSIYAAMLTLGLVGVSWRASRRTLLVVSTGLSFWMSAGGVQSAMREPSIAAALIVGFWGSILAACILGVLAEDRQRRANAPRPQAQDDRPFGL